MCIRLAVVQDARKEERDGDAMGTARERVSVPALIGGALRGGGGGRDEEDVAYARADVLRANAGGGAAAAYD